MLNREDARPPTRLTVAQKGWFHLTRLQVPLSLVPLEDGVHATRATGKITLVQKFPAGRGPVFDTRTRGSFTLELRLCTKGRLRTRAWASVGDLLSRTKQGLAKVSFEVKTGRKVEKAFVQVAQVSPDPTPDPPPVHPLRYRHPLEVPPFVTFPPPTKPPSLFQVKQLVDAMLGPSTDNTDWSKPFTFSPSTSPVKTTTAPPSVSDTHNSSAAATPSVSGATAPVQQSSSEEARPNAGENVHREFPRENSGRSQHRAREDTPRLAPQYPAFPQHHGGQGKDDSRCAPRASRQEVGYAYVQLWEAVFGES